MPVTTRIKRSWAIFFVSFVTIFVIFSGCRRSSDSDDPSTKFAKSFGKLPYLSNTSHPELSKEYAKLIEIYTKKSIRLREKTKVDYEYTPVGYEDAKRGENAYRN